MTPDEARHLINTQGRRHTLVVYGRKADGTPRRFVCRYYGAGSARPHHMVVWDIEKGRPSTICLDLVDHVKVCTSPDRTDRGPKPPGRTIGAHSEAFLKSREAAEAPVY